MNRVTLALSAAVALVVALTIYGEARYRAGVTATTAAFVAADKKGAENVRETAQKTLAGIGVDTDPDSLLDATNGLRDD